MDSSQGKQFTLRAGDETGAPKIDARRAVGWIGLMADAVNRQHGKAIGDTVGTLSGDPGVALALLFIDGITTIPADGCWIKQNLGAGKAHQAGSLWKPLVPADQQTEFAHRGLNRLKTHVAGAEIVFLIKSGIIRNVHFAIGAGDAAISLQNHSCIVMQTWGASLE